MSGKESTRPKADNVAEDESPEPDGLTESYWPTWGEWLRQDFLRAWFLVGSLAWDGFGAIQVRYLLDPYQPGQGPASAQVYLTMFLFVVVSIVAEVYLYRRWWPQKSTPAVAPRHSPLTEFEGWRFWRRF